MSEYGLKDENIKTIKNILSKYKEIEECIIFGSRALDTFKPGSDVDLALKGKTTNNIAHKVKTDLEKSSMPFMFDILDYNSIKNKDLVKHIDTLGKLFYRRMEGWKETTLGEIAEITSSKRIFASDYLVSGIPFYRSKEIIEKSNGREVSTELFISSKKFLEIKDRFGVPEENNILLTSVGTIGIPYLVQKNEEFYFKDGNLTWFKNFKDLDSKFLFLWLRSNTAKEKFKQSVIGSTQQALTIIALKNISIFLPSLPEQRAIAAILSTLDDKIELLQKENKTFEAIAQNIFKRWFVDFEFPFDFSSGKLAPNGKPYKSSGGKMINSELGKIPVGWRVGKFGDFINICGGTTPDTSNPDFWNGDINWTSPKDLSDHRELFLLNTEKRITQEGLYQISSRLLPENTLLLSSRAPIGYMAITTIPLAINQGYIAFLPHAKIPNEYMLFWLKVNLDRVISAANGSTFLEISKSSFRNIETFLPDLIILDKYLEVIQPLLNKIKNNIFKTRSLKNVRDAILPKLLSGEVRVK